MKNYNMQTSNCNMADGMMHMHDACMPEHRMANEAGCYMRENDSYGCGKYPIGMGYVPWQEFKDIYDLERGLNAGTIFAELEKPFWGRRAYRR